MSDIATPQTIYAVAGTLSALVIAFDAGRLGAHRGRLGGGFLDMGPVAWFFGTWLLWIVTVPCYAMARQRLVDANRVETLSFNPTSHPAYGHWMVGVPVSAAGAMQPGWYPDPYGEATQRWWSGRDWTAYTG